MQYRRRKTPGATYFFTVVTHQRRSIFHDEEAIDLLWESFRKVKQQGSSEFEVISGLYTRSKSLL
ncbi:hypothetical protein CKA32_004994 [Geitlerinema sp. FC II]|nr:hypothetical protein CKA32_004994 [Geitlerinema sp. FC II]